MARNKDWREDFAQRVARYNATVASGEPDAIATARADYPTLQEEIANRIGDLEDAEADPVQQAVVERALQTARALRSEQAGRRREREQARQRARNRTVRLSRTVELPTKCARCGAKLDAPKTTGRPRLYCSPACRKAAYEDRRAHRDGAVQVQVIEKVVTEHVAHSGAECLHAVLHSAKRRDGVIEGLVSMLATTPAPALRPRWFEIEDYVKRLTHALDRAENRAHEYLREHPDWQG